MVRFIDRYIVGNYFMVFLGVASLFFWLVPFEVLRKSRFFCNVRGWASIVSPNVIKVFDVGFYWPERTSFFLLVCNILGLILLILASIYSGGYVKLRVRGHIAVLDRVKLVVFSLLLLFVFLWFCLVSYGIGPYGGDFAIRNYWFFVAIHVACWWGAIVCAIGVRMGFC